MTGSEPGHLELSNGRLIYTPVDGPPAFNVMLTEASDINFPWHYFGGGFKMRIGSEKYRFSFIEPYNDYADISAGRAIGKRWKRSLTGQ